MHLFGLAGEAVWAPPGDVSMALLSLWAHRPHVALVCEIQVCTVYSHTMTPQGTM